MRNFIAVMMLVASFPAAALTVVMEDGCPVAVNPGGAACRADPSAACENPGAVVRWSAPQGVTIDAITKKGGSASFHNCGARGPADYQCIVRGNSGDYIDYNVTANGCTLDPRIILK